MRTQLHHGKGHSSPQIRFGFYGRSQAACVHKPRPMSVVTKRSPISATAELLLHNSRQSVVGHARGMSFPLAIAPSHGESGFRLTHASLGSSESITQRHLHRFSRLCTALVCTPQFNPWFLGSSRLSIPNSISIGSDFLHS